MSTSRKKVESLEIKRVPIGSLHLDPANARLHPKQNLEAIKASLLEFGQAEPLVVQKNSGKVIGGNGRMVAMKDLGWQEVSVVEVDLDGAQATALGIALNRTADLAEWDKDVLGALLSSVREEDVALLTASGYTDDDLSMLIGETVGGFGFGGASNVDDIPAAIGDAVTKTGDVWVMGDHRLLCGDSSKAEDVDRLLAGQPIHLVNTDPPYNVKVEPRSNNAIAAGLSSFGGGKHHQRFDAERDPRKVKNSSKKLRAKDRPLANDFVSDEAFDDLLMAWFGNISRVLIPGRSFYIWGGYANCANYPPAMKACELYFSQAIIWVKEHPVLTRKDFMGNHEWCFYGWREGAGHQFFGPNNVTDVWNVKKISPNAMVHLTEKPVELAARAMLYSSKPGENVLDLFGGSGSTMIGCEETKRRGFLIEMDVHYCDVIVRRWQDLTHRKAVLEETDQTFDQVAADRGVQLDGASSPTVAEVGAGTPE